MFGIVLVVQSTSERTVLVVAEDIDHKPPCVELSLTILHIARIGIVHTCQLSLEMTELRVAVYIYRQLHYIYHQLQESLMNAQYVCLIV